MEYVSVRTDRLVRLYPKVDERETPLPRFWSPKDKFTYIGLSQNNLRVHYKGSGKNHKDAASVRATYPIPASCGVFYFEVRVVSKGRDGYMGIGVSAFGVNLNRLPGWEKNSFGYHADDGCVFSSSATGTQYGPTFSTGDVVGCGFNAVNRTIFFTKNGINLGTAVSDVSPNLSLYPTVGLETPGEVVEANFGQSQFVFDFEGLLSDTKLQTRQSIEDFPLPDGQGSWQADLHKLVLSYLVHHGYRRTAQKFAESTGQKLEEENSSIKNRQRIQSLILRGKVSQALWVVRGAYPGLLDKRPELLFRLKCRQFVEMIGGYDTDELLLAPPHQATPLGAPPQQPRLSCHSELSSSSSEEGSMHGGVGGGERRGGGGGRGGGRSPSLLSPSSHQHHHSASPSHHHDCAFGESEEQVLVNGRSGEGGGGGEGEEEEEEEEGEGEEAMDVNDKASPHQQPEPIDFDKNPVAIGHILGFGRELQELFGNLPPDSANVEELKTMLQDSFSLLAYTDPLSSPVSYLLNPLQREPVCAALNSAILESKQLPGQPPLEFALGQAAQCLRHMSRNGLGAAAFTGVQDIIHS